MNRTVSGMDIEVKKSLLRKMLESRFGDMREQRLIRQGKGWFHVSGMGHEGVGAMGLLLNEGDYCFPFYRDRAFNVVRGVSNYELALSFYAKRESSSGGRQLPAHYSDRKLNIWSHLSPIAAHMLPACGAAWGLRMDGKGENVVYVSVGDGGTRQGDFYEAVCFAKEHNLPMIFVVEDNKVAISTKTDEMNAMAIGALREGDWAVVDGTDASAVYEAGEEAVAKARDGQGPQFIWAQVERLSSHSSADDHRNYRSEEEILKMHEERDPVERFKKQLVEEGVLTPAELNELEEAVKVGIKEDYVKAESAEDPKSGDEKKNVLGPVGIGKAPPLTGGKEYRMADAINIAFKDALETNEDTCFFGEDVEDPLGGVFKLTKGLSTQFPNRVNNSPLAESTILGIASGLASYGKRPIFEIQFIDFISPGWNQLVNNLANLRWRSNGNWTCPAIIYAPCGGYLPGGALWHSQTNESVFSHYPGLIVLMPSTPEDAAGMLMSALACEDPVMFLIPKHMLWAPKAVSEKLKPIPLGKAAVRNEGDDVTLVAWGNCMEVCEEAMEKMGHSVELIDLRSIVPWDKEAILESIQKTGRLVVVQEDTRNSSVGQMIISTMMEHHEVWSNMVAPPVLVSKGNMHIGFNPVIEYSSLPDTERVFKAVNEAMSFKKEREVIKQEEKAVVEVKGAGGHGHVAGDRVEGAKRVIKLPNLGEGLREARVIEIFKKEGEVVEQDDALCEVETDKAVFPVESAFTGAVGKWLVAEEDLIQVGQDIVELIQEGEADATPEEDADDSHITTDSGALSSEVVKALEGVLPASLSVVAEWKKLRDERAKLRGRSKGGVFSYTTMVAWAVVKAMEEVPAFRRLLKHGQASEPQEEFDVGFAVAMENDELETAVIPKANKLSWPEFVGAYRDGLKKVRDGVSQSKARTSILLTSMGPLNIRHGNPIVVPPAMGTVFLGEPYFEYHDGEQREVVALDFSFDHRWANGAGAGRFLKKVKDNIEHFDISELE